MKNCRFIIKAVFISVVAIVIGTVGYVKYVKPKLDAVFWAYMDSRFQDSPEGGSQEESQPADTMGNVKQSKGAADIQTAETHSRKVNELTKNNKDLEGFSTIRDSMRYDIIDAKLTKEVEDSHKGDSKKVIIENGKITNEYTAFIITVDVTNVKDVEYDITINTNHVYFFDSSMKIIESIEISDIDNPMYGRKSSYRLLLKPGESIREVCYYYIKDELLEGDYIAQYTVNPCGHPLNYNVTPDYREYDYIVRYNLKDLLSMNEDK